MIFDFMKKSDIDFIDTSGCVAHDPRLAIKRARDVEPHFKAAQREKYGEYKFAACPGMLDYSRIGYIIPAWGPIKIKSNSAGVATFNTTLNRKSSDPNPSSDSNLFPALAFQPEIIDGVLQKSNNMDTSVYNFPSPWRIRCRKGFSALVMPPFYHSKHLEYLDFLPGVVDYSTGFQTINFITAIKRPGEVHIEPGEPLVHIILIPTNTIIASYGKQSDYKVKPIDDGESPFRSYRQWYSRFLKINKKYKLFNRNKEDYEIYK